MIVRTLLIVGGLVASLVAVAIAEGQTTVESNATAPAVSLDRFFSPPAEFRGKLGDFRSVLVFDDGRPVRTAADWQQRRGEILQYWHGVMGEWPDLLEHPAIRYLSSERVENFTRCKVQVEVQAGDLQTAYLLIPDGPGPFPAVLSVFYDAESSAGLARWKGADLRAFGQDLARRGFVTLCLGDTLGVTDRKQRYTGTIQPISQLAHHAANCANLLASLPQVDAGRIGIVGHSFGGKWAMMASCLYDKFACACWSDAGVVWDESEPNTNWWEPWYLGYESGKKRTPGLVTSENPRTGAYRQLVEQGHDLHELHALMAPRPLLVSGGAFDRPRQWVALNHAVAVNELLGYHDRVAMTSRATHTPTPESNEQMYRFFERFLKAPAATQPAGEADH